ncbi:hypothetical protein COT75_02875 [Candidatus Beckwithbacteria bacterium CG10_big_fil_rev_8_21_14_0_10_34_10]|uniref:Glycosyltransferase 2-like domain-containing protein n=1 Tax=Candidatus Beckwithbacteria bacterium CG10_big_fil_rev_8_21_14_0_10_34_10 TaxID=1974495 RepID=A0A2H0WB82_9BACT|nr:MAG: hypothetical protein COT75_02875 [Candidatus Beckwithbacteria bacterium CG10_big_fil_rev_8_21_14_0_10_34_10]
MKISVIITIYNEEKHIEKCLSSLKEQSFKNFEVIVIDDGSTDKTREVLAEFKTKDNNSLKLKILKKDHQGPAKARNLAVTKSKGDILVFLDGDMFFDKDFLKQLISPIEKGKAKGTFSTEEYVANWNNCWARAWNYNWNLPDKRRINPQNINQAKDFRAILKKEFDKVGGFEDIGYTDTWTLSEKLKYKPQATKAKYYHFNPSSLKEIFNQSKWVAKRKYKLGGLGKGIALLRANPIFSLISGLKTALIKKEPGFLVFKLVYDFGLSLGLLEKKKHA